VHVTEQRRRVDALPGGERLPVPVHGFGTVQQNAIEIEQHPVG
jgi:hypothetical protein